MTPIINEKRLHLTFEISIILKGLHALIEVLGGFLILITTKVKIVSFVILLTSEELGEDPNDFFAHYVIKTVGELSLSSQHFISLYLLSHGIIKLILVVSLLRKKLWAYPSAVIVFSMFIVYQLYRYTHTHSIWLLLLTALDLAIIFLTIHEYHLMKKHQKVLPN